MGRLIHEYAGWVRFWCGCSLANMDASKRDWRSFKLRRWSLNTLALRLQNGWAWCSDSYPAGKYADLSITWREFGNLKRGFKKDEHVLVDRGWHGDRVHETELLVVGFKKPIGGELEEWQQNENDVLGHFRGLIENDFGDLKNHFKVLQTPYTGDPKYFNLHFRIMLALHNLKRLGNVLPREQSTYSFSSGQEDRVLMSTHEMYASARIDADITSYKDLPENSSFRRLAKSYERRQNLIRTPGPRNENEVEEPENGPPAAPAGTPRHIVWPDTDPEAEEEHPQQETGNMAQNAATSQGPGGEGSRKRKRVHRYSDTNFV